MLVFLYTFTEPPAEGEDIGDFRPPDTIYDKSYDNGRYLYRSGVYFSHPSFAGCRGNNISWSDRSINWIKLEGIYNIQLTGDELGSVVTFYYNTTVNYIHVATEFKPEVCYLTELPSCNISELADCASIPSGLDDIQIKFIATDRTKTIVFGDIKAKALIDEGTCHEMHLGDDGYLSVQNDKKAQIQYFQATPGTNETFTYLTNNTVEGFSHYKVGEDLNYVVDVWLTGYKMCEMSGSLRPNPDPDLNLEC